MKKTTPNPTIETRIEAARAVFDKYASFLAEVEAELNHPPGYIFEMLLGGSPQNPWSNGFEVRESLQEQCSRDTKTITDGEADSAAWEIVQVFGNLELAPIEVHHTAAEKVEAVIRRHQKQLAA